MSDFWGGLIGGISGIGSSIIGGIFGQQANESNIEHSDKWNSVSQQNWEKQFGLSQQQFDFQKQQFAYQQNLAENANQIRVNDMKKAGLNPVLAAGSGTVNAAPVSSGGSGSGSPSFSGANQSNPMPNGINSAVQGYMMGAQLDMQKSVTDAEANLKNSQASYYQSLVGTSDVPGYLEREATDRSSKIATEAFSAHIQHLRNQFLNKKDAADMEHTQVLTQKERYLLKNIIPAQYQSVLLDNLVSEGTLDQQSRKAAQDQLNLLHQQGELEAQKLKLSILHKDLDQSTLNNAITQYYADLVAQGIHPSDSTTAGVKNWVDKAFSFLPQSSRSALTTWMSGVWQLLPKAHVGANANVGSQTTSTTRVPYAP